MIEVTSQIPISNRSANMADTTAIYQVNLAPRARLTQLTALSLGMTEKAIRRKIEDGKWLDGREYHRDPDGNIWLDFKGIMQWVAKEPA